MQNLFKMRNCYITTVFGDDLSNPKNYEEINTEEYQKKLAAFKDDIFAIMKKHNVQKITNSKCNELPDPDKVTVKPKPPDLFNIEIKRNGLIVLDNIEFTFKKS